MPLHHRTKYLKLAALLVVVAGLAALFIAQERLTHDWRYFNAIDHLVGKGDLEPDPDKAFTTLERLAGAGHNASACFMTYIYFHGYEDPKVEYKLISDDAKMVRYGEQAFESKCLVASYLLGVFYQNKYLKSGNADDKQKAIDIFLSIRPLFYVHSWKRLQDLGYDISLEHFDDMDIVDLAISYDHTLPDTPRFYKGLSELITFYTWSKF